MKHQFNMATLAKLSKQELCALKANLKAQFNTASSVPEKTSILSNIKMINMILAHK